MAKIVLEKIIDANAVKNNGGVMIYGKTRDNVITKEIGRTLIAVQSSNPMKEKINVTEKLISGGVFANTSVGNFIMRAVTRAIAGGVSNSTILMSPRNTSRKSIRYNETRFSLRPDLVTFDLFTGLPSSKIPVSSDSFGNDNAARVSRSTTSKLTYLTGDPVPEQTNYDSKV